MQRHSLIVFFRTVVTVRQSLTALVSGKPPSEPLKLYD